LKELLFLVEKQRKIATIAFLFLKEKFNKTFQVTTSTQGPSKERESSLSNSYLKT